MGAQRCEPVRGLREPLGNSERHKTQALKRASLSLKVGEFSKSLSQKAVWDKTVTKSLAITRLNRKGLFSNSKATVRFSGGGGSYERTTLPQEQGKIQGKLR